MYCGIDVSKNKSNACILDDNQIVVCEFDFKHNKEGFDFLEQHLTPGIKIGMETTGVYCKALFNYLRAKYDICYVDNAQMKVFSKLDNPGIKNDRRDAKLIAHYIATNYKTVDAIEMNELKDLSRLYQKTIKQLTRYKFMFANQMNIIFPELETEFDISVGKTIPYLLLKHPSPAQIAELSFDEMETAMTENLSKHGSLVYKERTLTKIKELASKSIGIKNYPTACLQYTIKTMLFYESTVKEIKTRMAELVQKTPYHPLLKEFGYNTIGVATIIGEVGDIRRFPNHKKFVSFCGLDVTEKQSGTYTSVNCRITKRGNSILRFTFHNLVLVQLRYKTPIAEFYYRLRKEKGKHPKKCMTATARKIAVKTYYHMLHCHESQTTRD